MYEENVDPAGVCLDLCAGDNTRRKGRRYTLGYSWLVLSGSISVAVYMARKFNEDRGSTLDIS